MLQIRSQLVRVRRSLGWKSVWENFRWNALGCLRESRAETHAGACRGMSRKWYALIPTDKISTTENIRLKILALIRLICHDYDVFSDSLQNIIMLNARPSGLIFRSTVCFELIPVAILNLSFFSTDTFFLSSFFLFN